MTPPKPLRRFSAELQKHNRNGRKGTSIIKESGIAVYDRKAGIITAKGDSGERRHEG